jgi:hypothetical protein
VALRPSFHQPSIVDKFRCSNNGSFARRCSSIIALSKLWQADWICLATDNPESRGARREHAWVPVLGAGLGESARRSACGSV